MQATSSFTKILLHREPVDFRKSINGLGAIVECEMNLNLFDSTLFVFCCKRRKKIKILYWDKTGFALWYKKLEEDRFPWPEDDGKVLVINNKQLQWLLDGIDIWSIKPHQIKSYEKMN